MPETTLDDNAARNHGGESSDERGAQASPPATGESRGARPRLRRLAAPETRSGALVVLTVLAVSFTLFFARALLLPIVLAFMLSFLFRPLIRAAARYRVPSAISAALVLFALSAAVVMGAYWLVEPASRWVRQAPESLRRVEHKVRRLRQPIEEISEASKEVSKMTDMDGEEVLRVSVEQPSWTNYVLNATGNVAVGAFIAVALLYFLLASGDTFIDKIADLSRDPARRQHIQSMVHEIEGGISRFLITYTAINLVLGIVMGVAMWLLGMPNPALWGVMAGLLNYVPYLGPAVGVVVVAAVALLSFDSMGYVLLVPAVYFAINSLEGTFITPSIMGRSLSLNPVMVFLSLAFWGWVWGVGGALLAVPLLAAVKIGCEQFARLRPLSDFIAS